MLDLYGMGFDPVMSAEERRDYHTPGLNEAAVAEHLGHLRWAEGLVFVYPTWWYSLPAMLKGWIDRVWVPHATFELPQGAAPIQGRLHNIRLIGGILDLRLALVVGPVRDRRPGPPDHAARRCVPCATAAAARFWLGHYRMDSSTPKSRGAFLSRGRGPGRAGSSPSCRPHETRPSGRAPRPAAC